MAGIPEIADLDPGRLVGGMDIEAFNLEIRERVPKRFAAAYDPDELARFFDLAVFETLLATERAPSTHVDVITGGLPKRLADLHRGSAKSSLTVLSGAVRRGATIRLSDVQRFHLPLEAFVRAVAVRFAARSQMNVYLTPPGQAGFEPHFDTTDIFIVQCLGAKEWTLFEDYTGRVELPLLETPWDPDRFRPLSGGERLSLASGDVLYIPRGVMHQARCEDQPSLHLTISIAPLTVADVLLRELNRLAESDVGLRRRLNWSVEATPEQVAAMTTGMHQRLAELAISLDVASLLAAEAQSLRREQTAPGASGELQAAISPIRSTSSPQVL